MLEGNHLIQMTNPVDTADTITNFIDREKVTGKITVKSDYSFLADMEQISHT
mgnify:CR=1 FL=1